MKTLKKAIQRCVFINKEMYSVEELRDLVRYYDVWYFKSPEERNDLYDFFGNDPQYVKEKDLTVNCDNAELKVVLKDGYYTTVMIRNGKTYYVTL